MNFSHSFTFTLPQIAVFFDELPHSLPHPALLDMELLLKKQIFLCIMEYVEKGEYHHTRCAGSKMNYRKDLIPWR